MRLQILRTFIACIITLVICNIAIAQQQLKKPNIIIILADDLGWSDLSSYGSSFYETPHLDSLAVRGIRFTNSYAASPVCSPTRASLLTGKYPNKTGITDWIPGRQDGAKAKPYEKMIGPQTAYQLHTDEKTIAELALENGYTTFFSGKWHLGETDDNWPEQNGFQYNKGGWSKGSPTGRINDSTGGFFTPYKNPRLTDGPKGEYLSNRLTDECLSFLETNSQSPFLLVYSLYAVHNPLQAPDSLIRKYKTKQGKLAVSPTERFSKDEPWMKLENDWKKRMVQDHPVYAAMIENMDSNIGRILDKLEKLGIDENTLVIFTSDNGGLSTAEGSPTSNNPLRAGKGWLYEGGIRVPMIMYWKNKIHAKQVVDIPVMTTDIYPTVAALMNQQYLPATSIDGKDIFQLLQKPSHVQNRKLFWHYPHYSNQGGKPSSAIRDGYYKLIYYHENGDIGLYDLKNDMGEKNNIAVGNKKLAEKMKKELLEWIRQTNSLLPVNNPSYHSSNDN